MMLFLLSFIFTSSLAAGKCSFTVGGKTFDLSALDGKVAQGDDSKISTYQYAASVCSDMKTPCEDIMTGQKIYGNVYQFGGEPGQQQVCWDMLAQYSDFEATKLDSSAPNGATGFSLNFANGDPCRGNARKTVMNMICDPAEIGKLSGSQDDYDSCQFNINYPTKYACGDLPPQKWGINGTFSGNMTCISPDCKMTPDSITVKGTCQNMMAVVREGNDMSIWEFKFDTCGGYMARGTVSLKTSGIKDDDESFLFDMNMHHDGTVWILVNMPTFPYDLMAWVELKLA